MTFPPDLLLLVHAAATLIMVGIIWFVQIVHYPLLAKVGEAQFVQYSQLHQKWTTLVVGPPMLLEALAAVWLIREPPPEASATYLWAGIALLFVNWISTAVLQIPLHHRLEHGYDPQAIRQLVRTNWVRTLSWTARGGLALALLWKP